ncbi:MAG: hypothetical protein WDM70_11030 [Nitrosomonadales bacterium]
MKPIKITPDLKKDLIDATKLPQDIAKKIAEPKSIGVVEGVLQPVANNFARRPRAISVEMMRSLKKKQ